MSLHLVKKLRILLFASFLFCETMEFCAALVFGYNSVLAMNVKYNACMAGCMVLVASEFTIACVLVDTDLL